MLPARGLPLPHLSSVWALSSMGACRPPVRKAPRSRGDLARVPGAAGGWREGLAL